MYMKRVLLVVEVALVVLFIIFIAMFIQQSGQYKTGKAEYSELEGYVSEGDTSDTQSDSDQEDSNWLVIDHKALLERNPDYIGWISLPGLDISYPIVQGKDDEYYLHHTFDGTENTNGCVFLEAESSPNFSDFNSFLFGHNMRNGTMFGSLKRYIREEECFEENPEFYVYTKDKILVYSIYSYYITDPLSKTYSLALNKEGYEQYLEMVTELSERDCGVKVDSKNPTLTLSTCSGTGAAKKRLVVHGILKEKISK